MPPDDHPPFQRLVIAACGSIHAALLPAYIQVFRETLACDVRVAMTRAAAEIIAPWTIRQYSCQEVHTGLWPKAAGQPPAHIFLTRWADELLVLPATANMIGKAANGIADDLVSTILLSYEKPAIFAPAMNVAMWSSRAVRRNVKALQADGHKFITPARCQPVADRKEEAGDGISPSIRTVTTFLSSLHGTAQQHSVTVPGARTSEAGKRSA